MLWKGFKFGMLLQIAVGPMCVMVFNSAATISFAAAMGVVLAVALVDAIFIAVSGWGISALLSREGVQKWIRLFGCLVLVIFGANIALSALGVDFLPSISLFSTSGGGSLFVQGLVLTASNPLTIVFWSGVFASQVAEHHMSRGQLVLFGGGCVLSTLAFLTLIALLGSWLADFLPEIVVTVLNVAVGLALIYFGVRRFIKK